MAEVGLGCVFGSSIPNDIPAGSNIDALPCIV
jgi:hypothetical protein